MSSSVGGAIGGAAAIRAGLSRPGPLSFEQPGGGDVPVAGTNCTSHALALSADALYSTMYRSLAETSMVFRAAR